MLERSAVEASHLALMALVVSMLEVNRYEAHAVQNWSELPLETGTL